MSKPITKQIYPSGSHKKSLWVKTRVLPFCVPRPFSPSATKLKKIKHQEDTQSHSSTACYRILQDAADSLPTYLGRAHQDSSRWASEATGPIMCPCRARRGSQRCLVSGDIATSGGAEPKLDRSHPAVWRTARKEASSLPALIPGKKMYN